MKKTLITLCSLFMLSAASTAFAGDASAGKAKSVTCAACHGAEGVSSNGEWPNLAGQKEAYLVSSIKAYRDGTRVNALMSGMAKGLSDDDIANLAAHYSGLKAQ